MASFRALLLLFAATSSGLVAAADTALPKPDARLVADLVREAQTFVRTVSRPIAIFHWTRRSDVKLPLSGYVAPTDPRFAAYIMRMYGSFGRLSPRNDEVVGPGAYYATDSVVSRGYGGKNFVVYAGELSPGSRFLALDYMTRFLSSGLGKRIEAFGCSAGNSLGDLFAKSGREPACMALKLALSSSKDLNVVAARYAWLGAEFQTCQRGDTTLAFLVWTDRGFAPASKQALIEESPDNDPQRSIKAQLQGVFNQATRTNADSRLAGSAPFPALDSLAPSPAKTQAWIKTHFVGCGKFAEDKL